MREFPNLDLKNNSDVGVTLPKTNRFASENMVAVCTQKGHGSSSSPIDSQG